MLLQTAMTKGTISSWQIEVKGAVNGHEGSVFFLVNLLSSPSIKFTFDLIRIH